MIARVALAVGMMAFLWFAFRVGTDRVIEWEESPEGGAKTKLFTRTWSARKEWTSKR